MGILGLLRFAVLCTDLLAWPAIALGYPLFASIRAVESGSKYHMKKLVIYWTLFSLFSLFEFAFVKIIVWIPFWSSVRFVVIFWLVMPQFDGSNRAYQGLVHPLVMKLQDAIYMLQKQKEERICKRETFLDLVEKYIKENGPEAMEKLIALEHEKQKRIKSLRETESEGNHATETPRQLNLNQAALRDTEMLETTEKSAAATTIHQLPYAQSTASVNQTDVVTFVKDTTTPEASAGNRRPKSPSLMGTQQEFTCDLCKVTAMNEIILNAHLQGRKHKSKLESLKASMLCAKDTRPSPLYENQKCIKTQRETESEGKSATAASKHVNESPAARHDTEMLEAAEKSVAATKTLQVPYAQSTSFVNRTDAITNVRETQSAENKRPKTPSLVETPQEWTCGLRKVTTTSEIILNAHLQGRKHKSKLESLNTSMLCANDTGPSPLREKKKCVKSPRETESEGENAAATSKQLSEPQAARRDTEMDWSYGTHSTKVPYAQSTSSVNQNTNVKETAPPEASADNRRPKTPSLAEPQQEWTCDLCKVTATNEIILNAHLQGRKHKSKLKSLEASLLGAKDTGSSPLVQHKQSVSAAEVKELIPQKETAEGICWEMPPIMKAQQEWTRDRCMVTTTSEITLNGHLHGSKHKSKLQTLEASKLGATFAGPLDSQSSKTNHGNVSEKFIKDSGFESDNITTSKIEAKEKTPSESSSERRHVRTPPLNQAKQEWSCDICSVKTTGEKMLNDHFKGSKHKAKLQSLNTCVVNKDGGGIVKEVETSKYWCIVCNLKLLSDVDLASHLEGKRHSSNMEALIS